MKKIPTLFERVYENHKVVGILPNVTEGCEFVLEGKGDATIKWDGSCCAVINNNFYKRYDAKKGKKPPLGAIPCQPEPDPITGHFPCWVECRLEDPADKWFWEAYKKTSMWTNEGHSLADGTYEAIGKHFQGNPYGMEDDELVRHGINIVEVPRTFEGIKQWLSDNYVEGLVFWYEDEPRCKIKRTDFGLKWGYRK